MSCCTGITSREEKIKLLSGVRCPVSIHPCVKNSYLSTSATNQDEYKDEIDNDNNENDKDDNNKNVDNSYVNCRPVSVYV